MSYGNNNNNHNSRYYQEQQRDSFGYAENYEQDQNSDPFGEQQYNHQYQQQPPLPPQPVQQHQQDDDYYNYQSPHRQPYNNSSSDRLQAVEPSHIRPQSVSPHRRSTTHDFLADPASSADHLQYNSGPTEYTGGYQNEHYDNRYDSLRSNTNYYTGNTPTTATTTESINAPYSTLGNTGYNNQAIPGITVEYPQQSHNYDDQFYNNETINASSNSFNAFPTSNIDFQPPNKGFYDSSSTANLPLNGYGGNEEVYEMSPYSPNYMNNENNMSIDDEANMGFENYPISGDNYELNTFYDQQQNQLGGDNELIPDIGDEEMDEFGNPPEHPQRRKIEVGLLNGNLILDCPVPDKILSKYQSKALDDSREFKFMRYQAATCDPKDFIIDNFSLRQRYYKRPREIEILIVVTIYNENDVLLARTLKGIFDNIKHLERRNRSQTWGKDSWKKVVVCIVADGRSKINESAQALLAGLGVYQEGFARNAVNDKKVVSHIYEYSSMIGISSIEKDHVKLTTGSVPVQLLFCLKEENKKKINSHRWALQAFAEVLNPNVVVLLDAGTQPSKDSIYHLWKEFDKNPQVAGTCGEIKAMLGKNFKKLLNPLVAAQNFEYKMSNILDKPMESAFGFISVLPGAFSAYRYAALLNQPNGNGPLAKYFEGETLHDRGAGIFKSNMYLAEDRILCFELVAKQNCSWILNYCRSASAETDVPEEIHDFISQRRRWLNGSFFAAIYSIFHFHKLMQSSHSFGRKIALFIEFVYQTLSLLVSWFSLGSYFLVFRILTTNLGDLYNPCKYISVVFLWLYLLSVVTTFVLSFGNTPRGTPIFYLVIIIFFAVLMAYMIAAAVLMSINAVKDVVGTKQLTAKLVFDNPTFRDLIISTASTYALYFIASFIHLKPMHMFTSFIQYLLLSPSYVNVLNIYAFCNLHDISWGTKGATAQSLGDAKVTEDGKVEFVDAPITTEEINELYEKQMDILAHVPKPEIETEEMKRQKESAQKEKDEEKTKDYYAFIRSMVVLVWITTNFVIIAIVLETAGVSQLSATYSSTSTTGKSTDDVVNARSEMFLTVILWIVAFMAAFRLLGTVYYLISRMFK